MGKLKTIVKYILHFVKAKNRHGLHSPFAFELYNNVFNDKRYYYAFEDIESIRSKLLLTRKKISIQDHGAGSKVNKSNVRSVSDIAENTLKSAKSGQMLFRLVNYFKPGNILELGTSLGVTSMYLAAPDTKARMVTIEACPETAKVARVNFEKLDLKNIRLINDTFDNSLPNLLRSGLKPEFIFIDGNHQKDATLRYFNMLIDNIPPHSLIVFDDIHWSGGMEEAWEAIKKHPRVTVSFDLFEMGIVILREEQAEEHFKIRF